MGGVLLSPRQSCRVGLLNVLKTSNSTHTRRTASARLVCLSMRSVSQSCLFAISYSQVRDMNDSE